MSQRLTKVHKNIIKLSFSRIVHGETISCDNYFLTGRQLASSRRTGAMPCLIGRICYFIPPPLRNRRDKLNIGAVEIENKKYMVRVLPPFHNQYLSLFKTTHTKALFIKM